MTGLSVKRKRGGFEPREAAELLINAADEQALLEARERMAARALLLWNRRGPLVRTTIWGLILATAIAFLIPNRYQSTARLMPPDQTSGVRALSAALSGIARGQLAQTLATLATPGTGVANPGPPLLTSVLESDTVRDDLIHKFDLQRVYGTRYIEDTRNALAAHTGISEDVFSGITTITVMDRKPQRAAAMAREYVKELNWVVTNLNTSAAHRERVFLDQRLRQVEMNLEAAEQQFSQFASQKGAIDIPTQGKAMVTAAATLQGQLIAAEAELQELRQIFTDNNIRVRTVQARVDELRTALEKIAGKGANENSSAQQLYPSLGELPLLGVTYADLLRRMKVEEAIFETLTQEDEMAKVEEAKEIPSVKELDTPLVPQKKSFPPRALIMILGMTLAFFFAAAWIVGRSAWESADPGDPRKAAAIQVWADVHSKLAWHAKNGSPNGGAKNWLPKRFGREHENGSDE